MKFIKLITLSALVSSYTATSCGAKTTDAKQIEELCNDPNASLGPKDRKKYCSK